MKRLLIMLALMLAGCSTVVPVKHEFPAVPPALEEPCPLLKEADPADKSLEGLLTVMVVNYTSYHQCANKTLEWQEWYRSQKKIYNDVN